MLDQELLVSHQDGICTLTINRPERKNALNDAVFDKLIAALKSANDDGHTRVAILRGAGDQAFSSGYEISQLRKSADYGPKEPMLDVTQAVESARFPVIAMIYGYCVAGGLGLAASCDLRFAADNARLGVTPAKLGIVYPGSGTMRFINLIGVSATKELLYTAMLIDAPRAAQIGLVDHIYPAGELESQTFAVARQIADNAPLSIAGTKKTIAEVLAYQSLSPAVAQKLLSIQKHATDSEDLAEGQRAFQEKRKPKFKGR